MMMSGFELMSFYSNSTSHTPDKFYWHNATFKMLKVKEQLVPSLRYDLARDQTHNVLIHIDALPIDPLD